MARNKGKKKPHLEPTPVPRTRPSVKVIPQNYKQRNYIRTMQECDITFGMGSAGSGKTYLAARMALKAFTDGEVDKIVICRPAIQVEGEDLGFIPGGIQDKMDPYLRPIMDVFQEYWSPKTLKDHMTEGRIEVVPLAYMRGRTFKNAFIIADEMQNATPEKLLMLLSRIGDDSRMVITGDPVQSDINGHSCFKTAQEYLGKLTEIGFVHFSNADVVRHPTVEKILDVWPGETGRNPIGY